MGTFGDIVKSRRIKDPVRTTAAVLACSQWSNTSVSEICRMTLAVDVPGQGEVQVEVGVVGTLTRWPAVGEHLPVTIERGRPDRLRVEWDDLFAQRRSARRHGAEQDVPAVTAAAPAPAVTVARPDPPETEPLAAAAPEDAAERRIEQLERLLRLREAGVLTDDELAAEKRRILDA